MEKKLQKNYCEKQAKEKAATKTSRS